MLQYTFKIVNAILYTIRPSATVGACLLTLAAYNPIENSMELVIPLMTAAFFGSAFCFLINDLFDREKDLLNDKKRPIATGVLPTKIAKTTAVIFILGFLASTWFLGTTAFMLSFGFLAIAIAYSYINAKTGLFANVTVALMVSGTQWGVAIIQPDDFLWVSSAFLFFLSVPREVLLDWLDLSGDEKSGKRSFPMNHSMASTKWLVILCLILTGNLFGASSRYTADFVDVFRSVCDNRMDFIYPFPSKGEQL